MEETKIHRVIIELVLIQEPSSKKCICGGCPQEAEYLVRASSAEGVRQVVSCGKKEHIYYAAGTALNMVLPR